MTIFTCPIDEEHCLMQAPRSHWLEGAIAPSLFSKIALKAITKMAFSTTIFSEPIVCKQGHKEAKSFMKGAFSDLLRGWSK